MPPDATGRSTLLLIPARGGSRRLPGKSLRTVGGMSLLARAVQTASAVARRIGGPTEIIVSTDNSQYAEEARACGATVPALRPAELATDNARSIDVIRHALRHFASSDKPPAEVILLQPTSPLRTAEDVLDALHAFRSDPTTPLVTVTDPGNAPPHHCFSLRGDRLVDTGKGSDADDLQRDDGDGRNADGSSNQNANAGDDQGNEGRGSTGIGHNSHSSLGEQVALNGAVYVFTPDWVNQHDRLIVPGRTRALAMPPERSVDVDTLTDLLRAQTLWTQQIPWRPGHCYLIAEAGVNHNGDLDLARQLIDVAASAGADAVKFQTFSAAELTTTSAAKAAYQQANDATDESQQAMLQRLELSRDAHVQLRDHCHTRGIEFLSSAFGHADVDLLAELNVAAIKLGSGEITNHPLLAHTADTLRPIILSTGMSTLAEVAEAVRVLRVNGCAQLALLHCVSSYPAPCTDINLRAMDTLAEAFGVPVGYSDHTQGLEIACAAVARGARIIEKHFTLDRSLPGPDHQASLEPDELTALVRAVRNIEAALGDGRKRPTPAETDTRMVARRSLVAARPLNAGVVLTAEHLAVKRPGTGIPPGDLPRVLGRRLVRPVQADELLCWDHLGEREAR